MDRLPDNHSIKGILVAYLGELVKSGCLLRAEVENFKLHPPGNLRELIGKDIKQFELSDRVFE